MKNKCCHEAAHAVLAIHFKLHFNEVYPPYCKNRKLIQGEVKGFLKSDVQLEGFKISIAAGCLAELCLDWFRKRDQALFLKTMNPNFKLDIASPIDEALSKFTPAAYPDDFEQYTQRESFDPEAFRNHLGLALPLIEQYRQEIDRVASALLELEKSDIPLELKKLSKDAVLQFVSQVNKNIGESTTRE
jgi:hypothetical protein